MSRKHDLLINTKDVLIVLTPLAVLIGDREAIALQQVHYWLDFNEQAGKNDTHYFDEQWWTFNTWKEWQAKNFPFWSIATIQRVFESLVNKGLVILRDHQNRNKGKWVTICYDALDTLKASKEVRKKRDSKRVGSSQIDMTSDVDGSSQTDKTGLVKLTTLSSQIDMSTGNTETIPETSTETSIAADAANDPPKVRKLSEHQVMSDAIVQAFGWDWRTITRTSKSLVGQVARDLREASAKPHHVQGLYVYCDNQFDSITPAALSKHWPAYVKEILHGKLDDDDAPAESPSLQTYTRAQLGLPPLPDIDPAQFANLSPQESMAQINALFDRLEHEKGLAYVDAQLG